LDAERSFPTSVDVFVKNLSDREEWINISFSKNLMSFAVTEAGRFSLAEGQTAKATLFLDSLETMEGEAVIKISSTRVSSTGLSTGTGVEIPVIWNGGSVLGAASLSSSNGFLSILKNFLVSVTFKILFLTLVAAILWRLSKFLAKNFSQETA